MQQEQLGSSNGHPDGDGKSNKENSLLIKNEAIDGTPFRLVQDHEKWFCIYGKYRITEVRYKEHDPLTDDIDDITPEMALEQLEKEKWMVQLKIAGLVNEEMLKMFEEKAQAEGDNRYDNEVKPDFE